jgi:hypothetical protein
VDAICDDIWKRKKAAAPKVVQAKGIAPKPVTLSYEAKETIREIQKQVWGIGGKLEHLTEATLKGVAFEARELAKVDADAIWRGVAEAAPPPGNSVTLSIRQGRLARDGRYFALGRDAPLR